VEIAESNVDQLGYWDGAAGGYWAQRAERFNEGVADYHGALIEAAGIKPGEQVLDVGCGSGLTSRDAARRAGDGHVLGVDLSSPMLELARRLADREGVSNVTFEQCDAQVHPFPDAHFDVVLSRSGLMFFGDFRVAFTNLARALRPGGRLTFMAWQGLDRNEGARAFRRAVAVGRDLPARLPGTAGPFAFAEPDWTRDLLTSTGFTDVAIEDRRADMYFGRDLDDAVTFVTGQFASALADLPEPDRATVIEALRTDMAAHQTPKGIRYGSAVWFVTARRAGP
jgi:SAM-dependent methyltransferase